MGSLSASDNTLHECALVMRIQSLRNGSDVGVKQQAERQSASSHFHKMYAVLTMRSKPEAAQLTDVHQ